MNVVSSKVSLRPLSAPRQSPLFTEVDNSICGLINIGDFFDVCRLHSQQSKDVAANKARGPEVRDGHYGADISYRTDRNRFRLSDTEHCAGKVGSANN